MDNELTGRLRCFTLSDVIQLVSFSGQTGTLTLSQGWNSRAITFEAGRISYITAATQLATVEELLLKAGRITQQQLMKALAESAGRGAVDVLLTNGVIDITDLRRCLEQQLEETIYSLFLWRNCQFAFQSEVLHKEEGLPVDIALERLIMEGTRRVDEWIAISPVIPSPRLIFRVVQRAGLEQRPSDEQHVYRQIDGTRDVSAIAQAAGLTQFDTSKALFQLVRAGLVQAVPPDKVRIIELFRFLVQSIYVKLLMYGHSAVAFQFQNELNRFALDHKLKSRMAGGKLLVTDLDLLIDVTALIDLYKLFIAIENNKFSKMFEPEIVHGLVEGLYLHVDVGYQDMMRMYDFYPIEGLLMARGQAQLQGLRLAGGPA